MRNAEPRLLLPALREVYEAYARAAGELPGLPDALRAELWTSAQLGTLEEAAPNPEGHRAALADLVAVLRHTATPGTYTFLKTMAALGVSVDSRPVNGLPSWASQLGQVTPGLTWLIQEGPLDGDRLVCEFRYEAGKQHHALVVRLGPGDLPTEIFVVGDVPAMMAEARKAVQAELATVQPIASTAVAARLRDALKGGATMPSDCYEALALARHRVDQLPK